MGGIGGRISTIRKHANLQQDEFAKLMGVSRQTASNWETEKKPPSLEYILKIADFGKVSLDWLILGVDKDAQHKKEIEQKDAAIQELIRTVSVQRVQSAQIDNATEIKKRKGLSKS